jgi:PKD repeat protein
MDEMPDGLSRVGTLQLRANRLCGTNVAPVAVLSAPVSGQAGQPLSFSGADSTDADGDLLSYTFDFDDGTTVTQDVPTIMHAFERPGVYRVSLTVTDSFGASDTATAPVRINNSNNPPPSPPGSAPTKSDSVGGGGVGLLLLPLLGVALYRRRRGLA